MPYAEFTALPGCSDEVWSMFDHMTEPVRREPGNLGFAPSRRSGSADTSIVSERYAHDKAVDAHMTAQHIIGFMTELASLVEGRDSVLSWLAPC